MWHRYYFFQWWPYDIWMKISALYSWMMSSRGSTTTTKTCAHVQALSATCFPAASLDSTIFRLEVPRTGPMSLLGLCAYGLLCLPSWAARGNLPRARVELLIRQVTFVPSTRKRNCIKNALLCHCVYCTIVQRTKPVSLTRTIWIIELGDPISQI